MSSNLYNFIYIAVIVSGGVTLTLTLILQSKERDKQHRAILLFVGAIFVYMIVDFVTYYYLDEKVPDALIFALITASDILSYVLVVAWVNLIAGLIGISSVIKMKWVIVITILCQCCSQALSISLGRYDSYSLHVQNGAGKVLLLILSLVYSLVILAICIRCIQLLLKKYQKSTIRNVNLVLVLLLMGYMIWIAYWDYSTWYRTEEHLIDIYAMDPLILLYAVFNALLIYYFYKKDPLKLQGSQIAPEDAVMVISRRYSLSAREQEVLDLINRGMSNPQIAAELSISENTVKRHVNNLFKKTETQSRHEIMFKISNINEIDL